MQFYTKTHEHYCGIDLHTKMMYVIFSRIPCYGLGSSYLADSHAWMACFRISPQ